MDSDTQQLTVLHILTLSGRNGEYGGPVKVARELCTELEKRGIKTRIFSGALKGAEPIQAEGLEESFKLVKPIFTKHKVSSLWNRQLMREMFKLIRKSDIVHIHYARDLIPNLAAAICIIFRKKYVLQTHGMVIPDRRLAVKILDSLLILPIMNHSKACLVLNEFEMNLVVKLGVSAKIYELPNGIRKPSFEIRPTFNEIKRIAFCGRLQSIKGISKFIELATARNEYKEVFEIYGPDGGDLPYVLNEVSDTKRERKIFYCGAVPPSEILNLLSEIDLLILPSDIDFFPMIVLEALSVGTPALVMPSCGIASKIAELNPLLVAKGMKSLDLIDAFKLYSESETKSRVAVQNFSQEKFGIDAVVNRLEIIYSAPMN
jgi:glycosyltransferase involved in cell wall biosynthesis